MSTIDFRPWMSLTQRLKARRAAERGDTRHAHERAIAGDLDRAAAQHSPATSTPALAAVPSPAWMSAKEAADIAARRGSDGWYLSTYDRLEFGANGMPVGPRSTTPTADVAEQFIQWEGTPRW